jgi:hypothetical protein
VVGPTTCEDADDYQWKAGDCGSQKALGVGMADAVLAFTPPATGAYAFRLPIGLNFGTTVVVDPGGWSPAQLGSFSFWVEPYPTERPGETCADALPLGLSEPVYGNTEKYTDQYRSCTPTVRVRGAPFAGSG